MNRRNNLILIPLTLLLVFVISFWQEVSLYLRWAQAGKPPMSPEVMRASYIIWFSFRYFVILCLAWIGIVSCQAIFPVRGLRETFYTALYLIFYCLAMHGAAAYVRNGRIKADVEELELPLPGAVMVDFNSAVAVERVVFPPGLLRGLMSLYRQLFARSDVPPVRIQGAGLTFMLPDERIHGANDLQSHPVTIDDPNWMSRILGVVDLRPQFRISIRQPHPLSKRLGTSIFAYTRDGIEVKTNINVLATLGHEPVPYFPLNVAYVGEQHPRNLRVVKFKKIADGSNVYRVESFTDDLDSWDRLEIHEHWQTISSWMPYGELPRSSILPYFDPRRVFAAMFARARHHGGLAGSDEIIPWVDLPVHVAVDLFREIISHYNFDEIYAPDVNGATRINQIRAQLSASMRNSGLLSYRPIRHRRGACLEKGRKYLAADLLSVAPQDALTLQSPKILRDRGIRIISSSFGDLVVDERIYKQRMDHWRAGWDQQTEIVEAGSEWESQRVRTRARIQAQQEFVQSLADIYRSDGNSKEALALRVLQALETAATDPKTHQLLPEEAFSMLRNIHDWLLPQDMGYVNDSQGKV